MTGSPGSAPRREEALRRFARFGTSRPRTTLAAIAVLAAASLLTLPGLRLEGDTSRLVPEDDRVGAAYRRGEALFGESNPLLLRFRGDETKVILVRVAESVRDDLLARGDVREGYLLPSRELPEPTARLRAALWNGDPGVRAEFLGRLEEPGLRRQLLRTRKRLIGAESATVRAAIAADPLAAWEVLEGYYAGRGLSSFLDEDRDPTGEALLLLYPAGSAEDGLYCRRLAGRIESAVEAARQRVGATGEVLADAAGAHAITAQTGKLLAEDMGRITAVAMILLVAVLGLTFGDLRTLALVLVPVVVAQLVLLAAARWLFNPIHFLTVGSVAVVLGMGVDVSIHLVARYRELLPSLPWRRAVEEALVECVPPLAVGTASTMAAFLALALSHSPGLVDLGLLTSIGLAASLVCTVLAFPGLVAAVGHGKTDRAPRRLRWVPRGLPVAAARHPVAAFAAGALVVAAGATLSRGLTLDLGVESLLSPGLPALDTARELSERRGLALEPPLLVKLTAPSLEQGLAAQRRLDGTLTGLVASGAVAGFRSPSELVVVERTDDPPPSLADLERSFVRISDELGLRLHPGWPEYLESLARAARRDGPLPADGPSGLSAPSGLSRPLSRYLVTGPGGTVHLQSYVTPRPGAGSDSPGSSGGREGERGWMDAEAARRVASTLERLDLGTGVEVSVSGILPVYLRVNELVGSDVVRVGLLGAVLVIGTILAFFRAWRPTAAALLPLAAALPVTIGVLVVVGAPLTPITLCFIAVVLGIGIDDAVHVLWRLHEHPGGDLPSVMNEVGPLITLTTVSTVIGFGALAASRVPVVASMGLAVAVGVTACWVFTVLLLPLASRVASRRAGAAVQALTVLLGMAALIALSSPAHAAPGAELPSPDSVLTELERRAAEVEAVEVSFHLFRSVPELAAPVGLDGSLFFQRPRSVEIRLRGAENLDLLSDGERFWWVDRDLQEVEVLSPAGGAGRGALGRRMPLLLFFSPELPRDELRITSEEPERARYRLRVEPREPEGWGFTRLVLELDRRYRLVWLRSEDGAGGWSEYTFEEWHRRQARGEESFRVPAPLPKGWWDAAEDVGSVPGNRPPRGLGPMPETTVAGGSHV